MKIIPVKFVCILTIGAFIICPILLYIGSFVMFYVLTLGNIIVPYYVIFIGIASGAIYEIWFMFTAAPGYCTLTIKNGTISNFVSDNTKNSGWCESIADIKKVELVGKEEVQKHFKQFNKNKAILIDFGNHNVKYIYADLFSKKQIKKIMNLLKHNQKATKEV